MFSIKNYDDKIFVKPKYFKKDIYQTIQNSIQTKLEGCQIEGFGTIVLVNKILDIKEGVLMYENLCALFDVQCECLVFESQNNTDVDVVVTKVEYNGIEGVCGPLNVFVPIDYFGKDLVVNDAATDDNTTNKTTNITYLTNMKNAMTTRVESIDRQFSIQKHDIMTVQIKGFSKIRNTAIASIAGNNLG